MIVVGYKDLRGRVHASKDGFKLFCGFRGETWPVAVSEPVFPEVKDERCPECMDVIELEKSA
jgi:hypothetical protein